MNDADVSMQHHLNKDKPTRNEMQYLESELYI
jgi:hypothetical protein